MSKRSNVWLMALVCSMLLSVFVGFVSAADNPQAPPNGAPQGDMSGILKNLTAKGFDVTAIQAAVDSGDNDSAKSLLDKFFTEHPEEKPQMPPMDAERMKTMVQDLASKGNDVSKIQAALDGGDTTTAQTLLDEFFKAHPDARPTPPADGQKPAQ